MIPLKAIIPEYYLTERFVDRQVSLDNEHWCSRHLAILKDVTTSSVQNAIYTSHGIFRALKQGHLNHQQHFKNGDLYQTVWNLRGWIENCRWNTALPEPEWTLRQPQSKIITCSSWWAEKECGKTWRAFPPSLRAFHQP